MIKVGDKVRVMTSDEIMRIHGAEQIYSDILVGVVDNKKYWFVTEMFEFCDKEYVVKETNGNIIFLYGCDPYAFATNVVEKK